MKKEYQALSIDSFNGKTYWHSKTGTEEEVLKHAKRYCRRSADLIIYDTGKIRSENKIKFYKSIPSDEWQDKNNDR
jgi:hypothetical protein